MKELNNNKLLYVSTHDAEKDPGVEKKIRGFCAVAEKKGLVVERVTHNCKTISSRIKMMRTIVDTNAKTIIFRSFGVLTIVVLNYLYLLKKREHVIICDQPSPLSSLLKEIWHSNASLIKKLYYTCWAILSGPWSMWAYNRIIQYAPESKFFSLGNKKKTLLLGNGIDINTVQPRLQQGNNNWEQIKLVGVANLNIHHGFDRIIRSIAIYNSRNKAKAYFSIIGGNLHSPVIKNLKNLASSLNVAEYITFHGFKNHEFISREYNSCDLAVGSLGLYRIGLDFSSTLKVREYCLTGIPFIVAGQDPDFPIDVPFRFVVPNDESIEPIVDVLEIFPQKRCLFSDEQIREYAFKNLSLDAKFDKIINGLL